MIEVDKDLQSAVIKYNGTSRQLIICKEEPSELIQAICKMERYQYDYKVDEQSENYKKFKDNLVEEMVDTYIVLQQLQILFNVSEVELNKWLKLKQERQERLMK